MVNGISTLGAVFGHASPVSRTPATIFDQIFFVFLVLGTVVGIVVIGYAVYNAVKYRKGSDAKRPEDTVRPKLGSVPEDGGGGKKLFLSFGISAFIVVGLILWTYQALLFVEAEPDTEHEMEVDVIGGQFSWEFVYPNGESRFDTLRVPRNTSIELNVTSRDVMHNIGIPELNAKTDAIPGQTTSVWFVAEETGTYTAQCFELCGAGHSGMNAEVIVMDEEAFDDWYASTTENGTAAARVGDD
jgi:cytochrome c oxidase subunit 2